MAYEDPGESVVFASMPTAFEADTITMKLRNAGINAQTVDVATAMTFAGTGVGGARVLVRRADLERARRLIHEIEQESASIDWDAEDVGSEQDAPDAPLSRRAAWTIVLLILVPLGLMAAMSGQSRGDPILVGLASTTMLVGVIIAGWLLFGKSGMTDENDPM